MSSRRRLSAVALVALLTAVSACGTGTESGKGSPAEDESRNAAIATAAPGKPSRAITAQFGSDTAVQHDPASKRTVSLTRGSIQESLYVGAAGLIDVANPWNEAVPTSMPIIHGEVRDVEPDGNGGWYIGGRITGVGSKVLAAPAYIIHLGPNGEERSFTPPLAPAQGMSEAMVIRMWLDPVLGKLVVTTWGMTPPRVYLPAPDTTLEETHRYSTWVLEPVGGRDVTANHFPALKYGFWVVNVVGGVAYLEAHDGTEFGTRLDGVKRYFLEALDLRTRQFTGFGNRFYAETCTNRSICRSPNGLVATSNGLIASIVTREAAFNGPVGVDISFLRVATTGTVSAPFATQTYMDYAFDVRGWTVIGNTLFVGICSPGEPNFVRAYSTVTGLRIPGGYRSPDAGNVCITRSLIRMDDELYVVENPATGTKLVKLSKTTLQPEASPFTRTVTDASGASVSQDFLFTPSRLTELGEQSMFEIPVYDGRAWFSAEQGLQPRYLRSKFHVTDENGSTIDFDDGLAAKDLYAYGHFQVKDGWLYALTKPRAVRGDTTIRRWNMGTLAPDDSWSFAVPDATTAFAVGTTSVLVTGFPNQSAVYTALDIQTGFPRFTFNAPIANSMTVRTLVSEGDVVWATGLFNSPAGQHAVARFDMTNGTIRYSAVEPSWCTAANPRCLDYERYDRTLRIPLVADGDNLYSVVAGQIVRINKTTMETVKGPRGTFVDGVSALGVRDGQLYTYDTTARQVTRFLVPSLEARGAIGAPMPASAASGSTSIVSGLATTATGVHLLLRHPVTLNDNTFGFGVVNMNANGTLSLGLRTAVSPDAVVSALPVGPVAGPGEDPLNVREEIDNGPPAFAANNPVIVRVLAGHRSLTVTFSTTALGSPHRVVDQTGKVRCTTSTDVCVLKNLSPSVALSLSVVPADRPDGGSVYSQPIKPSFVTKKGATVKVSSLVKPGKAKPTWTVKGGCRLNGAKTALTVPKKKSTCTVRVKGGRGRTAYDLSARVVVN